MAKSAACDNSFLRLIYNATLWANVAINATSSPITNIYLALHTADPGTAGDQTTSEVTYTSYARVGVARSTGGFTVTANSVSPVADVTFPTGTGGSGTATYFSTGMLASGAGAIFHSGTLTPPIILGTAVAPIFKAASTVVEN